LNKLSIGANLPGKGFGRLTITDDKIAAVETGSFKAADCDLYYPECYLAPGFIDLQINGGLGHDFTADPASVYELARQLPRWGCTAFLPTLVTSEFEAYRHSLKIIGEATQATGGARIFGTHLEGPYLNERYKGAHDSQFLRLPNLAEVKELVEQYPVKLMTLAPELPGALEVIDYLVEQGVVVSTGHTAATYEKAMVAYEAGAGYVTHIFNAMPPLHHRHPSLIAAALDSELADPPYLGLILDGIHVHPAMARLVARLRPERLTLVTDAIAGMGMPPGSYKLAGLEIVVDETSARLNNAEKTLAGSILTMDQAVRNAVKFLDFSLEKAFTLASYNPAAVLGYQRIFGALEADYLADLVVLDQNLQVQMTFIRGEMAYSRPGF
jgi:N-acetylglucosamine-6-phosphate deacetylase